MPNENKYRIAIAALGIVVLILAVVVFTQRQTSAPLGQSASNTDANSPGQTTGAASSNTSTGGTKTGTTSKPTTGSTIHLTTPIANQSWKIAQSNLISWDRAAGVSGQILLLDATTKALVGVILAQTGPNQTSYSWPTRYMSLTRSNPALTSVLPGKYVVRVSFDGNNLGSITSGPITIVQ